MLCLGLIHLSRCIFISSDDADRVLKLASRVVVRVATMDLSEARGLVLFRVVRRGIGISRRLSAIALYAYRPLGCSPSNPSVSRTNQPPPEKEWAEMEGLFTGDAQGACDFNFSASKFSPFFHILSVMAAILRASVRRAMVGLMPLVSDRW